MNGLTIESCLEVTKLAFQILAIFDFLFAVTVKCKLLPDLVLGHCFKFSLGDLACGWVIKEGSSTLI